MHVILYFILVLLIGCTVKKTPVIVEKKHVPVQAHYLKSTSLPFVATIPRTWAMLTPKPMQRYRYFIYANDGTAEFSLSQLDTPTIDVRANVDRWRNQLGLLPLSSHAKIHPKLIKTPFGVAKEFLIISKKDTAIKVRIFKIDAQHYFFKIRGDRHLVEKTKLPKIEKKNK